MKLTQFEKDIENQTFEYKPVSRASKKKILMLIRDVK